MRTETISNVRPSWVAFGWFIAVAVSALLILALVAFGFLSPDSSQGENGWIALALLIGFLTGGLMVGLRTREAPVLHGVGIGLFSLVVWLLANLLVGEPTGWTTWRTLPTAQALALLVLQTCAAVVGARIGARRGR